LGALPLAYALFLALVGSQRLAELAWSRRNLLRERAKHAGVPGGRAEGTLGFSAMVAVHVGSILFPAIEVGIRGMRAPLWVWLPASMLFVAAQALRYWTLRSLGTAWNVRAEVSPATHVVTAGPYRWIRHPNYLAICIELLALPAIGGAWISLVVLQIAHAPILWRRIQAEEAMLFALPGYAAAMTSRGRLLPRFARAPDRKGGGA
jgi:methyltransferase